MSLQTPVPPNSTLATTASSNQSGSNDFVKKLFLMLLEDSYKDIVRWTKTGDSFVVINTNEFTKDILPRHFKHSNFASFVRQLNKYDFHKVKIPNDAKSTYPYGEDAWEFKHPDFKINDRESLDNIKRKGPNIKKPSGSITTKEINNNGMGQIDLHMKEELKKLRKENEVLQNEVKLLTNKYKTVVENIVTLKNYNERYDRNLTILANTLLQAGIKIPPLEIDQHQHHLDHSPKSQPPQIPSQPSQATPIPIHSQPQTQQQQQQPPPQVQPQQPHHTPVSVPSQPPHQPSSIPSSSASPISTTQIPNPKFHVLLVEDDNVCIQLCRKFLVKYGCQVTVVTDGLNAISTVEHTKYDLVLMDIVMPNLDGATATSIIRSFDTKTPIIAMTGNIEDQDLVNYLQNGMSDILAKPFTKDDLYSILAKHLLKDDIEKDRKKPKLE
ncbi:unnamed protein product [Candida verbasci]|uniref:Transcription factor n=1 Tax=Candida verbasci TaxID=1227364 RepID=A0A9W4U266_9ASCO|nr:unnamed protein product [Candida verbasci]